jgi:hypothetical protein
LWLTCGPALHQKTQKRPLSPTKATTASSSSHQLQHTQNLTNLDLPSSSLSFPPYRVISNRSSVTHCQIEHIPPLV